MSVDFMGAGTVSGSNSYGNIERDFSASVQSAAPISKNDVIVEDISPVRNEQTEDKDVLVKKQASQTSMEDAVKRANNKMATTHCEFAYNDKVNRVSISVIDDNTGEVVREIPPEESLKMLEKMWEITGLMVDEKR